MRPHHAATAVLVATSWWPVSLAIGPLGASALLAIIAVSAALGSAVAKRRSHGVAAAATWPLAWFAFGVVAGTGPVPLVAGAANALRSTSAIRWPVAADSEPAALVALAACVVAWRVSTGPRRLGTAAWLVVPPVGLLLWVRAASAVLVDPPVALSAAWAGAVVTGMLWWLATLRTADPLPWNAPRWLPATAVVAAISLGAWAVPGLSRPRPVLESDARTQELADPLRDVGAELAGPDREVMRVRWTGTPTRLLSQVVLDRYDGLRWRRSERFVRGSDVVGTSSNSAVLDVEVLGDGSLGDLPHVGTALALRGAGADGAGDPLVWYRSSSGSLRADATSHVRVVTDGDGGGGVDGPGALGVEHGFKCGERNLVDIARSLAPDADRETFAAALASALRSRARLSRTAVDSTSSYGVCAFVDAEAPVPVTAARLATTYAVLLNAVGVPARLVIGWRCEQPIGATARSVRTHERHVWVEADGGDGHFVAYDPAPEMSSAEPSTIPPSAAAVAAPIAPTQARTTAEPPAAPAPARAHRATHRARWGAGIGLTALAAAALWVVRRWWVWRRRYFGDPARRVEAAWAAYQRALGVLRRDRRPNTAPLRDVLAQLAVRAGGEPLPDVAGLEAALHRVRYDWRDAREDDAVRAWSAVDSLRSLRTGTRRRRGLEQLHEAWRLVRRQQITPTRPRRNRLPAKDGRIEKVGIPRRIVRKDEASPSRQQQREQWIESAQSRPVATHDEHVTVG